MKGNESLAAVCWTCSATIAAAMCCLQLGVMLSLMAHWHGFSLLAPMMVVAMVPAAFWLAGREGLSGPARGWPAALTLAVVAVSLGLSLFFYDFSWDGLWYHQPGIIHIARDWNPLTDPLRSFERSMELWVRHYAKGPWYMAAAIYRTTGHIEAGKCINWLGFAAMWFAVLGAALEVRLTRPKAVGIALVISLNPVVVSELTSFLVDGIMASFLTLAISAIVSGLTRPRFSVAVAGVAGAIVCINAKFTGLVFLCFVIAAALAWCALKQRAQFMRLAAMAALAIALGTCVWGYNPYVTNTLYRKQPFYPVLGSAAFPSLSQQGREGIERYETPKNLVGRNRLIRLGYAIFGRPGNQPYYKGPNATLMWPFTARLSDLYSYDYQETRVAGFGPFFSGCLILALGLGVWLGIRNGSLRWPLVLTTLAIVASLLINAALWWPRYGPQLWLLPVVPLILAFKAKGRAAFISWALLVVLLANASIVSVIRMQWERKNTVALRRQLRELRESGQEYEVNTQYFHDAIELRLSAAGVRHRAIETTRHPYAQELIGNFEHYPDPATYRVFSTK
jgi:hypothetical protein